MDDGQKKSIITRSESVLNRFTAVVDRTTEIRESLDKQLYQLHSSIEKIASDYDPLEAREAQKSMKGEDLAGTFEEKISRLLSTMDVELNKFEEVHILIRREIDNLQKFI